MRGEGRKKVEGWALQFPENYGMIVARTEMGPGRNENKKKGERKMNKTTMGDVAEVVGAVVLTALYAALAWAFLAMTPDRMSAECEAQYEIMAKGK